MSYFIIALICQGMLVPGLISYLLLSLKEKKLEYFSVYLLLSVTLMIGISRTVTIGIAVLNPDLERAIKWSLTSEIGGVSLLPVVPLLLSAFLTPSTKHLKRLHYYLSLIGLILALFFVFIIVFHPDYYLIPYSLQELPHPVTMGTGFSGPGKKASMIVLVIYDLYVLFFALYSWVKNREEPFFTTLSLGISISAVILLFGILLYLFSRPIFSISPYFAPLDLIGLSVFALTALISLAQKSIADARALDRYNRQLSLQRDRLNIIAYRDRDTGLPNRKAFFRDIPRFFSPGNFLALVDIDNLSFINMNHGFTVGDSVIHLVAKKCRALKPPGANLYRLSPDTFSLLTPGNRKDMEKRAEELLSRFSTIKGSVAEETQFTVSIGMAEMNKERTEDITAWISQANTALDRAKQHRNCMVCFNPELHLNEKRRLKIVESLSQPLNQINFHMNYQPVVDKEGKLSGAEALVRWKHPQLGMVSPVEFIPLAEATGFISRITHFVLNQTVIDHKKIKSCRKGEGRISVNLSGKDLLNPQLIPTIDKLIAENKTAGSCLGFEVTETALIADWEATIKTLTQLRERGFPIYLDDFGTGYSSLNYLKELPLNKLKIDRAFITDIPYDKKKVALLDTIIKLGKDFGLELIIEGVDNRIQLDFLRERDCDYYQGYYFSRPLSIDDFIKWQ